MRPLYVCQQSVAQIVKTFRNVNKNTNGRSLKSIAYQSKQINLHTRGWIHCVVQLLGFFKHKRESRVVFCIQHICVTVNQDLVEKKFPIDLYPCIVKETCFHRIKKNYWLLFKRKKKVFLFYFFSNFITITWY